MDLAEANKISRSKTSQLLDGSQFEDAFRSMQSGKHTWRFVISLGEDTLVP